MENPSEEITPGDRARRGPSTIAVERDLGAAIVALRERNGLPNNAAVVRAALIAYAERSRVNIDATVRRAGFDDGFRGLIEQRGWPFGARLWSAPALRGEGEE